MSKLSRANRVRLIKVFALLSIVRWQVILFTAMAQYLVAFFVCNSLNDWRTVISNYKVHLIILATAFVIAAGFIINNFYDLEKDLVNRPHKTLFNRVVSKAFCLNAYIAFNIVGLMISGFGSFKILIFFTVFAFGLWFYSHKLQKIPLIRELSASILAVASVFAIGVHYNVVSITLFVYAGILMGIIFNRELVKDFRHIEGDRVAGNDTIVIYLGQQKAYWLHLLLSVLTISLTSVFTFYSSKAYNDVYAGFLIALLVVAAILLSQYKNPGSVKWAHRMFKVLLILSTFYLVFL